MCSSNLVEEIIKMVQNGDDFGTILSKTIDNIMKSGDLAPFIDKLKNFVLGLLGDKIEMIMNLIE